MQSRGRNHGQHMQLCDWDLNDGSNDDGKKEENDLTCVQPILSSYIMLEATEQNFQQRKPITKSAPH